MNLKRFAVADVGVALYLLCAFIFLIVPISSGILDVALAINISIAFAVLFNTMFAKEVLDMSFYPTLLLFTTIFRISLNVSSTRLILSTGSPGNVVETFGQFVGGGDLIMGTIVFIILIIIQFMVINKGSERVAEVTARFTLDAMPGKQMAIDADLNTGAITDDEPKVLRAKIQEESSFFGSMDGAVKYVKGDATAGLIITFINIIGGIAMGMLRQGLDFNAAIQKYTILTIGDGLVSQIPSLLISLSTNFLQSSTIHLILSFDIFDESAFSFAQVTIPLDASTCVTFAPASADAIVAPPVYAKRFNTFISFVKVSILFLQYSYIKFQLIACSGKTPVCLNVNGFKLNTIFALSFSFPIS